MSAVASTRRATDENNAPPHAAALAHAPHDALFTHPSPRHRQPLASFDNLPNVFPRYSASPVMTAATPVRVSPVDATPVRSVPTKVDPEARKLPLPKGLVFAPPPPPAKSLLPPLPTPPHARQQEQHVHSGGYAHHVHHAHSINGPGHPMGGATPARHLGYAQHPQSTPSAHSVAMTYSSPSTMSHMPSTPDIHQSPYPAGPIELHELLPPARFPGALPAAFLNQGDVPANDNENGDEASANSRRTLVSCNPWDYRPEDHGKSKPRRRFSPGELDMLEILWSISHNPHKWQRQKLARWFGCTTRHLTVWFQNRRQDLKKAETLVQMAESNPDTASRALAAVNRANRGEQAKFSGEQQQVIMDIVSDRLLPEMWFSQQPSGSSPTPGAGAGTQRATPSPTNHMSALPADRGGRMVAYAPAAIAAKPSYPPNGAPVFALKPFRRGFSLDDVCTDREQSMTNRPSARPRPRVETFDELHKNDPRYREALISMLPSELSSDAIEPPEDAEDDESNVDEDSPTRKRARHASQVRAPRPTLPAIGLGRPSYAGHRPRSSFGRASSSDVLACSSRARYLAHTTSFVQPRAVTDPVPSRSASAGPALALPPVPEHRNRQASVSSTSSATEPRKRKLSRQGSWSHLPSLTHKDSFDRARGEPVIEERSSPVPEQTRSPTPTDESSPRTVGSDKDVKEKSRLVPEGRSIYSFSKELEPEIKRGTAEMDENVLTGAHALMELFRGR